MPLLIMDGYTESDTSAGGWRIVVDGSWVCVRVCECVCSWLQSREAQEDVLPGDLGVALP